MDKLKLIKTLTRLLTELCDFDEERLRLSCKDNKMKFRQYDRLEHNNQNLKVVDITIEF